MAKFKVGDKVRIRKDLEIGGIYNGDYTVTENMKSAGGKIFTIKNVFSDCYRLDKVGYYWTDEMLEEVKEHKMEKTVLEIINDGYTGKKYIHECGTIIYVDYENILRFDYHKLDKKPDDEATGRFVVLDMKLKEYRKEYTFEEAFKALEVGKEIESAISAYKVKKLLDGKFKISQRTEGFSTEKEGEVIITLQEIKGKWYIND